MLAHRQVARICSTIRLSLKRVGHTHKNLKPYSLSRFSKRYEKETKKQTNKRDRKKEETNTNIGRSWVYPPISCPGVPEFDSQSEDPISWQRCSLCECVCVCVSIYIYIYTYKTLWTYRNTDGGTMRDDIYIYIYIYIYTHTHIHTYTHTRTFSTLPCLKHASPISFTLTGLIFL